MAIPTSTWWTFAMLNGMSPEERAIAQQPLIMTMMPGSAATKSVLTTVAISQQASESIGQQKQVASATIRAIKDVIDNAEDPSKAFAKQPALRGLQPGTIATQFEKALPVLMPAPQTAGTAVAQPTGTPAAQPAQATGTPAAQPAQATGTPAAQPAQATGTPAAVAIDPAVVKLAGEMVEKALAKTRTRTFTAQEAASFQAFVDLLDPQTQAKLIKN